MSLPAMILAAGFGTRMGALTRTRPKPLIEVAGRPLLDHAIAAVAGCAPVIVNGHHHAAQLAAHLRAHHPKICFSVEEPDILDSGGGIKQALPLLGTSPIVTINADAVWRGPDPVDLLRAAWDPTTMDGLMLLVPHADAVGRQGGGDMAMDATGRLTWDKSDAGLVHTGAQILKTDTIASHPAARFSLRDIWQRMIEERRLYGVLYPGRWADVGHPGGIAEAEEMLSRG